MLWDQLHVAAQMCADQCKAWQVILKQWQAMQQNRLHQPVRTMCACCVMLASTNALVDRCRVTKNCILLVLSVAHLTAAASKAAQSAETHHLAYCRYTLQQMYSLTVK